MRRLFRASLAALLTGALALPAFADTTTVNPPTGGTATNQANPVTSPQTSPGQNASINTSSATRNALGNCSAPTGRNVGSAAGSVVTAD